MSTLFQNRDAYLNNNKVNWLDRHLPDVLLISFVLQQFGLSYHLSFGSVGLVLIAYLVRNNLSLAALKIPFLLTPLILLSYFWVLARYGYDERILSVFPTLISMFFLFAILRKGISIKLPSASVLVGVTLIICSVAWYQLFVDNSLQVPESYFAMGSNISLAEDSNVYDFYQNILRTDSIYSEPSYFGMVLCCLYVLFFYSTTKLKLPAILIIIITQLMAGSGLGIAGMLFLITFTLLKGFSPQSILRLTVGVIAIIFMLVLLNRSLDSFEWAIFERVTSASAEGDSSGNVRFLSPFILIFENIKNGDWIGVPSNFYDHFMYTNLYDSMGDFPGHNGILGILTLFGLFGLLMLVLLAKRLRSPLEWSLVLIIGSQNGGFLTYEKVFSLIFIILALRGALSNQFFLKRKNAELQRPSV